MLAMMRVLLLLLLECSYRQHNVCSTATAKLVSNERPALLRPVAGIDPVHLHRCGIREPVNALRRKHDIYGCISLGWHACEKTQRTG